MIFDLLFFVSGLIFLMVMAYLYMLATAALWPGKKVAAASSNPVTEFAIIIPAHNESDHIQSMLDALRTQNYPQGLYQIFVIADNCDDNTAEIAVKNQGVTCLQRLEPQKPGKGFALGWAFPQIIKAGHHLGFIVIDADTRLDKDFLAIVDQLFASGVQVVQGYSQTRHPERSLLESLSFLGFALNRNLRYQGRRRLGWTSNLLGTGMCFSRQVIQDLGWNTTTMVEDIEYEIFLQLNGIRVVFAQEAKLDVELHRSMAKTESQRTRWDMGKFEVRNRYLLQLLQAAFTKRNLNYLDTAMELLLPPFSIFAIIVITCTALFFMFGYNGPSLNLYIWIGVITSLLLYIVIGLISAKASGRVYSSLLIAPFFILWRCWIICVKSLQGRQKKQW